MSDLILDISNSPFNTDDETFDLNSNPIRSNSTNFGFVNGATNINPNTNDHIDNDPGDRSRSKILDGYLRKGDTRTDKDSYGNADNGINMDSLRGGNSIQGHKTMTGRFGDYHGDVKGNNRPSAWKNHRQQLSTKKSRPNLFASMSKTTGDIIGFTFVGVIVFSIIASTCWYNRESLKSWFINLFKKMDRISGNIKKQLGFHKTNSRIYDTKVDIEMTAGMGTGESNNSSIEECELKEEEYSTSSSIVGGNSSNGSAYDVDAVLMENIHLGDGDSGENSPKSPFADANRITNHEISN